MNARERVAYPVLLVLGALDAVAYSVIAPVTPAIARSPTPACRDRCAGGELLRRDPDRLRGGGPGIERGRSKTVLSVSLALVALGSLGFIVGDSLAAYFVGRFVMVSAGAGSGSGSRSGRWSDGLGASTSA
jgi:hypothetical protein